MPRIKINDLPGDKTISPDGLKRIRGGSILPYTPEIGLTVTNPVIFDPEKVIIQKTVDWKEHKADYETK
ncbi:MAG: hypothetical protein JXB48_18765 [Candidatus Latescibacteria bacterium]|nr:hypothetical protein [Candidatus Latescibacterota bacterium]